MMRALLYVLALLLVPGHVVAQDGGIRANLANPIIVVQDMDASVRFYTQCLGFSIIGEGDISADVSKRTIGAAPDQSARAVYLRGADLQDRDPRPTGIALIEITGGDALSGIPRTASDHAAIRGEAMLSLIIEGIDDVMACAKAEGVTILNDIELSAQGRSRIASMIDPSGVRIEMYEYLPGE